MALTLDDLIVEQRKGNELSGELVSSTNVMVRQQYFANLSLDKLVTRFDAFTAALKKQETQRRENLREGSPSAPVGAPVVESDSGSDAQSGGVAASMGGGGLGGIGKSLTSLGMGIGGFLLGLGGASAIMSFMGIDMGGLKNVLINLGEAFDGMPLGGLLKLAAVMAGGSKLMELFAEDDGSGAVGNMAKFGLGLAGFLIGIAGAAKVIDVLGTNGSGLGELMKNLGEGFDAFGVKGMAALAAMAAVSIVAGPEKLALAGLAIGGFLAGIGAGDALIGLMGADGSGIAGLLGGIAEGLDAFSNVNFANLLLAGPALSSLALGMVALTGGNMIKALGDFFMKFIPGSGEKSPFQRLADDLLVFNSIDFENLREFNRFADATDRLADALDRLDGTDESVFSRVGRAAEKGVSMLTAPTRAIMDMVGGDEPSTSLPSPPEVYEAQGRSDVASSARQERSQRASRPRRRGMGGRENVLEQKKALAEKVAVEMGITEPVTEFTMQFDYPLTINGQTVPQEIRPVPLMDLKTMKIIAPAYNDAERAAQMQSGDGGDDLDFEGYNDEPANELTPAPAPASAPAPAPKATATTGGGDTAELEKQLRRLQRTVDDTEDRNMLSYEEFYDQNNKAGRGRLGRYSRNEKGYQQFIADQEQKLATGAQFQDYREAKVQIPMLEAQIRGQAPIVAPPPASAPVTESIATQSMEAKTAESAPPAVVVQDNSTKSSVENNNNVPAQKTPVGAPVKDNRTRASAYAGD